MSKHTLLSGYRYLSLKCSVTSIIIMHRIPFDTVHLGLQMYNNGPTVDSGAEDNHESNVDDEMQGMASYITYDLYYCNHGERSRV